MDTLYAIVDVPARCHKSLKGHGCKQRGGSIERTFSDLTQDSVKDPQWEPQHESEGTFSGRVCPAVRDGLSSVRVEGCLGRVLQGQQKLTECSRCTKDIEW